LAREREPELLVLVRCRDVLVPTGVHTRRNADHDGRDDARLGREISDALDLAERVDDDPSDPCVARRTDLRVGLVVAVQADLSGGYASAQRDGELARRRRVDAQALGAHPARDGDREEGLSRVVDVHAGADRSEGGLEGLPVVPGPRAQVALVEDEGGSAVLCRELTDADAGEGHLAVVVAHRSGGPRRAEGGARHMRSGAVTPRSSRPLASTWRVASLSHSRVRWVSETSSSPKGVTRRWSYHLWNAPASSSRYRATRCGSRSSAAWATTRGSSPS